jgi:hypothetical protein
VHAKEDIMTTIMFSCAKIVVVDAASSFAFSSNADFRFFISTWMLVIPAIVLWLHEFSSA